MNENTVPLSTITRPEIVTDEHLTYLDKLRNSHGVNLLTADYLMRGSFPYLNVEESKAILFYWLKIRGLIVERDNDD